MRTALFCFGSFIIGALVGWHAAKAYIGTVWKLVLHARADVNAFRKRVHNAGKKS